ncbi:hypothetical protein BGW42_003057 [Actinomortierella wolfii]|nr:hypothetical protein BGW42_003057 [Actinomortierella wolfii]
MPSKLEPSAVENSSPAVATNSAAKQHRQTSVFAKLPPELVLHIFSYLDVVAIFRFMDTCHFHRHLLLSLPEAWHRVRFVPISEYTANYTNNSSASAASSSSLSVARFHRAYQDSGASSPDLSSPSSPPLPPPRIPLEFRKESKRDEERGGSQSPLSEVFAVLRRLRRDNGLLPLVREIYMDSIDIHDFPPPLVMLFKFPNLRVLSSRYRRKQTSLAVDAHILRDMLRNGHVLPHSLKLERFDIWHPYMAEDDVIGFQRALDAICQVGRPKMDEESMEMDGADQDSNNDVDGDRSRVNKQGINHKKRRSVGVQLDIALCPGPDPKHKSSGSVDNSSLSTEIEDLQSIVNVGHHTYHHHQQQLQQPLAVHGGGIHWTPTATPTPEAQQQHQLDPQQPHHEELQQAEHNQTSTESVPPLPQATTFTINYGYPTPEVNLRPTRPPCSRVIWKEETCLDCGRLQERCWLCNKQCPGCGSNRSPPHVRHQRYLNMQMFRRDMMRKQTELRRQLEKEKREAKQAITSHTVVDSLGIHSSNGNTVSAPTSGSPDSMLTLVQPVPVHSSIAAPAVIAYNQGPAALNLDPQYSLPEFALFD